MRNSALNVGIAWLFVRIVVQSTCPWQNFVLNVACLYLLHHQQMAMAYLSNLPEVEKLSTQQTWMVAAKSGLPLLMKGVL